MTKTKVCRHGAEDMPHKPRQVEASRFAASAAADWAVASKLEAFENEIRQTTARMNEGVSMNNPLVSLAKLDLEQLVDWAAGYILVAVGRGDFRQAVDAMVRQAYANGYNAKAAERKSKAGKKPKARKRSRS